MPFGAPVALATLNTEASDGRAWLVPDELTLYFNSDRPGGAGGFDIYVATRDDVESPFGEPALVNEVSSPAGDYDPALTADALTIYISRFDPGLSPSSDIYVASRDNITAEFGDLELVDGVNDPEVSAYGSWISADGTVLYFYTSAADPGNLFRAERPPNGAFGAAVPLGELNTTAVETSPVPSDDGLTIFFASNRPGGAGSGDVWVATRSTTDDGFGTPLNVAEVNTAGQDVPSWLSSDGCRLYLSSAGDLVVAERGP